MRFKKGEKKVWQKAGSNPGWLRQKAYVLQPACHGAHSREEQGHADEDVNSNNSI